MKSVWYKKQEKDEAIWNGGTKHQKFVKYFDPSSIGMGVLKVYVII